MSYPQAPYYDDVRWPGVGGLRVPQEAAPASLATYKEVDLSETTGTVTLTPSQAGASLITLTPTADMTLVFPGCQPGKTTIIQNLAAETYTVTCEISGNTSNTAVVEADTTATVVQTGTNGGIALVA